MRASFLPISLSVAVSLCLLFACSDDADAPAANVGGSAGAGGSDEAGGFGSGTVGGAGGVTTKTVVPCGNSIEAGDGCAKLAECCHPVVADGFESYLRCKDSGWTVDFTCKPAEVCAAPLEGTLVNAKGTDLAVSCGRPASKNPPSLDLSVGTKVLRLRFATLPSAGAVFQVGAQYSAKPDGPADAVDFDLGSYGGIAGFSEVATSVSGTITVNEATVDADGQLTGVRATFDTVTAAPGATGNPPGEWDGPLTGSF